MTEQQRIGKRIAEIRKEQGLSQALLSKKANIDSGYIAKIELGRHSPGIKILSKIAKSLGKTIDFV